MPKKSKKHDNHLMIFPKEQLFHYLRSGKFKALSNDWKHESMGLLFDYELIVVTEGTLFLRYMDEDFTVSTGEYLILPPSTSNRIGFKKAYCSFYWLHFTSDLGAFPSRLSPDSIGSIKRANCFIMPQNGHVPSLEKIIVHMKQLQDLERNNYPDITLNAVVTAILTELYGQLEVEKQNDNDPIGNNQIYSDIADYIRRNISENLKITDIANAFGYSPKYLSHLFSEVRGISLKQFIMSQKIDTACYYLTDSDKTVTQVASELGFSDMHNFSRAFKKSTGLTPSAYRNTYAKRLLYHV
ncbi:AraC family transcriptional regulator [Butyrivibrio sp.]|uniref:helix-turn-helix domain-containing protein n=1 Tax=Butyrivibrio sp. TaxID=28121 RepID=UPI0025BFE08A|nr:helix-turn-helix transcriptional regulator [Butyrivibrio sp.]MBQ9303275.1 helix-turn-helix transcriptional regulator [Butyrivibrio sp.]